MENRTLKKPEENKVRKIKEKIILIMVKNGGTTEKETQNFQLNVQDQIGFLVVERKNFVTPDQLAHLTPYGAPDAL